MNSVIIVPDELAAGPSDIHRPLNVALVPEIADVIAQLVEHDPDVLAAVEDVDRSLIWEAFDEPPLLRLARSAQQARFYARLNARR